MRSTLKQSDCESCGYVAVRLPSKKIHHCARGVAVAAVAIHGSKIAVAVAFEAAVAMHPLLELWPTEELD